MSQEFNKIGKVISISALAVLQLEDLQIRLQFAKNENQMKHDDTKRVTADPILQSVYAAA